MTKHLTEYLKRTYPQNGKLLVDKEGAIRTVIIDDELDGIECKFNYDGCVEINTENYTYLSLSIDNLFQLASLIEKAEKMYKKRSEKKWQEYEKK